MAKNSLAKTVWQIAVIILLNLVLIAAAQANDTSSTQAAAQTEALEEMESKAQPVLSKIGSRGEEVRRIQQKLKDLGYEVGSVDGIFGLQTQKAVLDFQRKNGLNADGIVGQLTLAALGISPVSAGQSQNSVELLARVISAEARGESYLGQVAVGAVILNRVEHPSFPDTIAGVVYQSGAFTCMTDGQINQPVSESSRRAAQDALNGVDPSGGALYYYNPAKTSNQWMLSLPVITTIGSHVFCSPKP
ncbi:MAG: spore cortex-lytic enzyme [Acutalibacteraceae bacterium]|jgi:N-acetylmuramoyl-L-alanine amidase